MVLPQSRRYRTNPEAPEASGICDRCGFRYSLADLPFQYDWTGAALTNLWIRVCERCRDVPQQQLRPKFVPPDPVPVPYPRPPFWAEQEGFTPNIPVYLLIAPNEGPTPTPQPPPSLVTQGGLTFVTQGGLTLITES